MPIISLKLSQELRNRIKIHAEKTNTNASEVIREAVEEYLTEKADPAKDSFKEIAQDIIGSLEGPEDLSINKKYLRGYGRR